MILGLFSTEAERREEFARFLESEKALDVVKRHFISFLESERRGEFVRFLESDNALDAVRSQFISFLRSDEGKRLLVELLIEALARREFAPILESAETRLKNLAAERVASFQTEVETQIEASAASNAVALKRKARKAVQDLADRVNQDVRDHLSSYQAKVLEAVTEQMLFREDIARHVRPEHALLPRNNREIAGEHRISIREVKRRRRAALGLPEELGAKRRGSKRYGSDRARQRRYDEMVPEVIPDLAFNPAFLKKVDELELSLRSANCLKKCNIVYIGDLVQRSEAEMLRMPNFRPSSLNEIKKVLAQMGLHLGMEVPGWPPDNIDELAKRFEAHY